MDRHGPCGSHLGVRAAKKRELFARRDGRLIRAHAVYHRRAFEPDPRAIIRRVSTSGIVRVDFLVDVPPGDVCTRVATLGLAVVEVIPCPTLAIRLTQLPKPGLVAGQHAVDHRAASEAIRWALGRRDEAQAPVAADECARRAIHAGKAGRGGRGEGHGKGVLQSRLRYILGTICFELGLLSEWEPLTYFLGI